MTKEINIHREIIESSGQRVAQRMVGGLQEAGGQRNQKALAAIPDSKGILLSEMKQYLKQEQQLMNQVGKGVMAMMEHIRQASQAFVELDESYAKSHEIL